jgi:hypothetical protein
MRWKLILGTMAIPLAMGVCVLAASSSKGESQTHVPLPRPDHIVIVIETIPIARSSITSYNHINALLRQRVRCSRSHSGSLTRASEYLALFSGSTQTSPTIVPAYVDHAEP